MPDYEFRKREALFSVDRFSGVDLRVRGENDPRAARRSVNFRYTSSYGLRPRCGFARIAQLPADVRGLYSCRLAGEERLLAAAGDKLWSLDDTGPTLVGSLPASSGSPVSFCRDGRLFIIDGSNVCCYDGETLSTGCAYLPLFASNVGGEYTLREAPNRLTDRVRLWVKIVAHSSSFLLPDSVTELISVTPADGSELPEWTFDDTVGAKRLTFAISVPTTTTCEVVCTTEESSAAFSGREALLAARDAAVFGRVTETCVYLFSREEDGRVYYSDKPHGSYPPYSGADPAALYFPAGNDFLVGRGEEPVTAACRFLDRLFIFTPQDAWFVSTGEPGVAKPLHSTVGCCLAGGAQALDNNPVTVGSDGLYLWRQVSGYSECSADFVSGALSPELTPSLLASCVCGVCRAREELWLCPSAAEGGGAWIWEYRRGLFYRFEGFLCELLTEYRGDAVFAHGDKIFAFSESQTEDADGDVLTPVAAVWENGSCGFSGYPEKKHLRRAAFTVLPDGGEAELCVLADNGRSCSRGDEGRIAAASDPATPLTFLFAAAAGRFYTAKLRLRTRGGRSELRSASLGIEPI